MLGLDLIHALCFFAPTAHRPRHAAAYQVGLSFLTTHMRRAVAACMSPEVFFAAGGATDLAGAQLRGGRDVSATDPLGLAMEALSVSSSTG